MSTIVPRLYPNPETAKDAVNALYKVGFKEHEVQVVAGGADEASIAAAMTKADVYPRDAAVYAPHVAKGAALVIARSRPLMTVKATRALRRLNPIDVGIEEPDHMVDPGPTGMTKIMRGEPSTKLLDSDLSGVLMSPDWLATGFMPLISNSEKEVKNLATDMQPFSKLATDMKPWSNVKAGGPTLPIATIIRDDE